MKKVLMLMLSSVLVFAACSSGSTGDSECGSDDKSIYLITDIGGIDDKSFNEGTYNGVERYVEDNDGVCSDYITSEKESDYKQNLTIATDKNPDLVVAAGFLFEDSIREVALANPEQQYLLIDSPVFDEETGEQVSNITSALFAEEQGSYLAGVAAASKAKADGYDTVGFIGGMELELIIKFEVGFIAGVKSVDPDMKVEVTYVGDFKDTSLGKAAAEKLYNQGAYIIYHAAGGAGNGVIKEAQDRYADYEDGKADDYVWVIGVDKDQYEAGMVEGTDHSVVLTSMVKRVDVASYEVSEKTLAGNPQGGSIIVYDMANDGVGIPEVNPNLDDSPEILEAVAAAKEAIISGEIVVPTKREE